MKPEIAPPLTIQEVVTELLLLKPEQIPEAFVSITIQRVLGTVFIYFGTPK